MTLSISLPPGTRMFPHFLVCYGKRIRLYQWNPTPVLLPGKSHGRRSLEGCSPRGRWGSDMTSNFTFTFMHWRRKWQPTAVFLPGQSQGRGSLVGCHLWDRTESDTTEANYQQKQQQKHTDEKQSLSKWQWPFLAEKKAGPKIHVQLQETRNS